MIAAHEGNTQARADSRYMHSGGGEGGARGGGQDSLVLARYGPSSQKATSIAGVSVSPTVPSKSNRIEMSLFAAAFSILCCCICCFVYVHDKEKGMQNEFRIRCM